jgi:uncharacterized protein (DUF488 family)
MKFYTIGYGGRNPEDLVDLLKKKNIRTVVDVRLRPDRATMGVFKKTKEPNKGIEGLLAKNGISYISLLELGDIFFEFEDWQVRYQRLLEKAGDLLIERLLRVPAPFCLLCAEKRAIECHRYLIASYLVSKGHEVEHIE